VTLAPRNAQSLYSPERAEAAQISVIVPVLNEATLIRPFLQHLRQRAPGAEIIVVDGGSSDRTEELAAGVSDQVLRTERGRALQMNAGARAAREDVLWFLHVDLTVPFGCVDEIARCLGDDRVVGGFFRMRLPRSGFVYRLTDEFAHYAGNLLRMRCGDHGIFCRRRDFFELGGFPEVPLMEDVAFFRLLRRRGRLCILNQRIIVDDRRYQAIGPTRLTLAYGLIAALYLLQAPLPLLSRIYDRLCCRRV
jgi:rSAM/selenodomain-associated transferase 2